MEGFLAARALSCIGPEHKTQTKSSQIETLKGIVRAFGLDPDKILTKEALTEPHRTIVIGSEITEQLQLDWLLKALKQG